MKVYDIILEATPEEIARRRAIIQKNMATQKAINAQQQKAQQTTAQSQARRQQAAQMRQQASQPIKTAASQAASKVKSTLTWDAVKKKMASFKAKKTSGAKIKNRVAQKLLNISSITKRILTWVGFAVVMNDYFDDMSVIEEMVEHYNQTGDEEAGLPPDYYPMAVRLLRLETITTIVASAGLVKLISFLVGTATGLKWFVRGAGILGSGVTLGASIAAIAANEAATIAFRTFLMTEKGKEAVAWIVLKFIDPAVNTAGFTELLNGEIKKAGEVAKKGDKATTPAAPATEKPSSQPDAGGADYVNPDAASLISKLK